MTWSRRSPGGAFSASSACSRAVAAYRAAILAVATGWVSAGCDRPPSGDGQTPPPVAPVASQPATPAPAAAERREVESPASVRTGVSTPLTSSSQPRELPGPVQTRLGEHRRRLELFPRDANTMMLIAALMYVHGEPGDALEWIDKAMTIDDSVGAWRYQRALVLDALGRREDAIVEIERYLSSVDSTYAPGYRRLGELLVERDPPRAADALRRAIGLSEKDARARYLLGTALRKMGKPDEALQEFQAAAKLMPEYGAAHAAAADVLGELGRSHEAAAHATRGSSRREPLSDDLLASQLRMNGLDLDTVIDAAVAEARDGAIDKAEWLLITAVGLDRKGSASRAGYARVRITQGRYAEAVSFLEQAVAADPENARLHGTLAGVYLRMDRSADAIPPLRKALDADPADPLLWQLIGLALSKTGDLDGAEHHWRRALELAPEDEETHVRLADLYQSRKQHGRAIEQLRAGLRANPESSMVANALAWALATCPDGSLRNGAEAVQLATPLCRPGAVERYEHFDTLAAALAETGRFDEAITTVSRAITLANARGDSAAADKYKSRLGLYRQKRPYHAPE